MLNRSRVLLAVAVAVGIGLAISLFVNFMSYPPNTVIGTVDHRSDYENTNSAGEPITEYFVAIRPIVDNGIAGAVFGQVEDYPISKEDFDAINANDIVVARISWSGGADIVKILPQEQWIRVDCVGQPNYTDMLAENHCAKG